MDSSTPTGQVQTNASFQVAQPVQQPAVPANVPASPVSTAQPVQQLEQTVQEAQTQTSPAEEVLPLDQRPTEITITIPTQAYFLSGIRDFVVNLTQNMTGFSERWAYRFQAVVDELCNNAIEHGSKAGEMIKVTLISNPGKSLEVLVEDTGTGQDKMTAEQITQLYKDRCQMMTTQYLGFRGRGLPKIVGEWTDELVFEDTEAGGLRVRVKKYLRKEEEEVSSTPQNDPTHLVLQ